MSKATITESAAKEINDILSYIAVELKNPIAARNVHNAILNAVENLCIFPQSAALTKSATANAYGVRQQVVKNFCMFFITIAMRTKFGFFTSIMRRRISII